MNSELRVAAGEVEARLNELWTRDLADLKRPHVDEAKENLIQQSPSQFQDRLKDEFFGPGPLTQLLADEKITEIIVNGAYEIFYERDGTFAQWDDQFASENTFKSFIERLCVDAGMKIDLAQPYSDGRWRCWRVHLLCAPVSHCPFHLTLRRLPENPWTLQRLQETNWTTDENFALLRELLSERKNILIVGNTGSGKTSVLSALLRELPGNERVVMIEDTDELPRPNSASTKLLTRPFVPPSLPEITLTDLVRQSLRMRPLRLVMGEVRGGEAKDLLMALATGHTGSMGTLHANDARQALIRLEMLIQMGAPQWNLQAIRQLILMSVDTVVVCKKEGGHRRLAGIYKVAALENFGFLLEQLSSNVDK